MAKQKSRPAAPSEAAAPAEYTVVARRYRPKQFTDLVGQEPVAKALMNAIQSDRVAHAYLFTGVRGTGKTSTARILAKALNCEKGPTPTPCDQCETCKAITSGEDIDVLEIDGASNRGIDEIRAIRQNVGTRPSRSRYKIYIIDEVHMVTTQAFNALLKTLEEPPAHVKFIFATTDVQKIPITILSRCQRFDFAGITSAKIAEQLKKIVADENMQAEDEALMIVARRAGGSMRDAQSLLDQLLAYDGETLTAAKVHQLLGTATDERLVKLVEAMVARDAKLAVELLGQFAEEGLQLGELLDQLVEYWRALMLLNCSDGQFADLTLSESHRAKAKEHARSLPLDSILAGLDVLTTTKMRLRGSNYGLVLLEMAVLRLIRLDELIPVAQLAQQLAQGSTIVATSTPKQVTAKPVSFVEAAKKNSLNGNDASPKNVEKPDAATGKSFEEVWQTASDSLGPILANQLALAGMPAIFGPKSLVIRFPSAYTSEYDYCCQESNIRKVQKALLDATGQEWTFRVELDGGPAAATAESVAEVIAARKVTSRERNQEILQIPLIQAAVDKLGARLLKVDEGFGSGTTGTAESDNAENQEP